MRKLVQLVLWISLVEWAPTATAADYAIGADLSFLKQAEDRGTVFKEAGQAKPGLQIFKEHGNGPFPESAEGQKRFLDEVNGLVLNTPNNWGIGIFWWEPAATGPLRSRGFFDDDGNALPVLNVFDRFTRK